jgi:geranylgeranyl diphosphate synthase, type II
MPPETATLSDSQAEGIKHVPQDAATRAAIRSLAVELAAALDRSRPCSQQDLERHGEALLHRLGLPRRFLGFAMVAVSNEFWWPTFSAIPFRRRLFLLPHCLADRAACAGRYDSVGLHCAGCGNCVIDGLRREAEQFGYTVIVAEGTGSVLTKILDGDADAILGVACLDSLEKSFHRVVELGVPHVALPLLRDGCKETEAEVDQIRLLLGSACPADSEAQPPRSYIPLLRETTRMFQPPLFSQLLAGSSQSPAASGGPSDAPASVEDIALAWLKEGGKRLRPFVTIAAFAVARHGVAILDFGDRTSDAIPQPVRRIALAIEALHKASLVHDDIEDDDDFRYGRPTVHRMHGVGQAVNIGDYLIGLGYRLIAAEAASLGAACVADIVASLSRAHLDLCRGQGEELMRQDRPQELPRPLDVLTIYALKTSPAFEAALYAGLRLAGVDVEPETLRRYSTYLGEAFQIQNDLDDWLDDDDTKRYRGLDLRAARPTILRAFAAESPCSQTLVNLADRDLDLPRDKVAEQVRDVYRRSGAFDKAERLLQKLRARALEAAEAFPSADLQELMRFLVRMALRESPEDEAPGQ